MPKIIEDLPRKLTAEAKKQLLESGYEALNIRVVAKNCGVGIGTVYNYYPSKDALIAGFLLEDWKICIAHMQQVAQTGSNASSIIQTIYEELCAFMQRYDSIFRDAEQHMPAPPRRYHVLLRSQLASFIQPHCDDSFAADFVAEALLAWAVEGTPYPIVLNIIKKIIPIN